MNGELYVGTITGHAVYRVCDASCLTGIRETGALKELTIYPNPNKATFTVSFSAESAENTTILITDILGQNVFESVEDFSEGEHHFPIEIKNVRGGIYFLYLKTAHGVIVTKFVVM